MNGGLIEACRNIHTVKGLVKLLESVVDSNAKDEQGNTGLMAAVMHGSNVMVFDTLIQFGADVNAVNNDKRNALHLAFEEIAVTKGNHLDKIKVAKLLLEHRCDVNCCDINGKTPFFVFCGLFGNDQVELMKALLSDYKAKLAIRTNDGETPFINACANFCDVEILQILF